VVTVVVWIVAMLAWMVLVIYLGRQGAFLRHTQRLSNLLGFFLVLALPAVLFASIDGAREGVVRAALHTSNFQLALIHVLRLLAVGGIIKYMQGELPRHFVILAAIPDFLFAVSAVVVTAFEVTAPLSSTAEQHVPPGLAYGRLRGVLWARLFHVPLSAVPISYLSRQTGCIDCVSVSDGPGPKLHRPIVCTRAYLCHDEALGNL